MGVSFSPSLLWLVDESGLVVVGGYVLSFGLIVVGGFLQSFLIVFCGCVLYCCLVVIGGRVLSLLFGCGWWACPAVLLCVVVGGCSPFWSWFAGVSSDVVWYIVVGGCAL